MGDVEQVETAEAKEMIKLPRTGSWTHPCPNACFLRDPYYPILLQAHRPVLYTRIAYRHVFSSMQIIYFQVCASGARLGSPFLACHEGE